MSNTKIKNQDKIAIGVGFLLIGAVAVTTIFRSIKTTKQSATTNSAISSVAQENYQTISAANLQKKIIAKEKLTLLDIRSNEAYNEEHILDSLHIPADQLENISLPNNSGQIFLIADNVTDEVFKKALATLQQRNISNILVLSDNLTEWKKIGGQTITSGDPSSFANQAKVKSITSQELKDSNENNSFFLIDTRPAENFIQGHIKNATNIPFEELEKRRTEIPLSKPIAIYDTNEVFGFQAAARVYDLTGLPAYNLRGGLEDWQNNKFELIN